MGVIGAYGLPWEVLAPTTWRAAFLGYGRKPGFDRKAWKAAVRHQCDLEGIRVTNDDMADAVGIAIAGRNTQSARMIAQGRAA
jgi:Holliday junction resolvasome RuvABC endonuclease subunit